jgi:hypothetical protein
MRTNKTTNTHTNPRMGTCTHTDTPTMLRLRCVPTLDWRNDHCERDLANTHTRARARAHTHTTAVSATWSHVQVNHVVKQWYRYLESLDALGSDLGPTHGGQVYPVQRCMSLCPPHIRAAMRAWR